MTPQAFIAKWGPGGPAFALNERQGAQPHFIDLCQLLGVPTPGSSGDYLFEQDTQVLGEARGYADVFFRDHFAWENKAPGKNLDQALKQLLTYSLALSNPPLLVVCDRQIIRIHTQFNGHPTEVHTVTLDDLAHPDRQALLRRLWTDPESFRPKTTRRDITEAAAKSFATLADSLRKRGPAKDVDPAAWQAHADGVAHFLTQCVFCFFAEDVRLLPRRMFEGLVKNKRLTSDRLTQALVQLFTTMRDGGLFGMDDVPWFNGGLFQHINVPELSILEVSELRVAAGLNWSAIDASIFGTLFERGLDPSKRSQLGAHYTDPATIMRIVEPVMIRPLLRNWELSAQTIRAEMAKSTKRDDKPHKAAQAEFVRWLEQLKDYRVLDPACGSGNFLYLGLKALKDIEHKSHLEAAALGLDREADLVTGPHNVLGIEINEFAAELARVTVWIGELQWRIEHGYEFKVTPVLDPLDHIERRDALLSFDASGQAFEAPWPRASVVMGNPPFLGGSKKRGDLGDAYFDALASVFADRVPAGADLVCYWFDKARQQITLHGLGAAGLVATQAIRAGSNREVLSAIARDTVIYDAWANEPWVNDGAAVRVSIVSFGWGECCFLNGKSVARVASDLSGDQTPDLTVARRLAENAGFSFEGTKKYGDFDIPEELAHAWLRLPNPHGRSNADVLKPWRNGNDLTKRPSRTWIIDFGASLTLQEAALYEAPFNHLVERVKPVRIQASLPNAWWRHERPRGAMRAAIAGLGRYIATVRVSKHRYFCFLNAMVLPDSRLNVIASADDVVFGILNSRMHEVWSLATVSTHGDGGTPTYNVKSCFETFPFPAGLTLAAKTQKKSRKWASAISADIPADIATAAKHLNDLRERWLNPPEWTICVPEVTPLGMDKSPYPDRILPKPGHENDLAERTLTQLYNQRPAWLDAAHQALDQAVAAAYGWADYTAQMPEEEILKRLLALNRERVG